MSFTIKKENVEVYRIRHTHGSFAWADITIDEGEKSGRLSIASDYGSWEHYWGSCGSSFKEFLCGVNLGYVAGKFGEDKHFDFEATIRSMKADVIQARRDDDIDCQTAREYFDEITGFSNSNINHFQYEFSHTTSELMDYYEGFPEVTYTVSPMFIKFWETIWLVFVQELQKEITQEVEAV